MKNLLLSFFKFVFNSLLEPFEFEFESVIMKSVLQVSYDSSLASLILRRSEVTRSHALPPSSENRATLYHAFSSAEAAILLVSPNISILGADQEDPGLWVREPSTTETDCQLLPARVLLAARRRPWQTAGHVSIN